MTMTYNEAIEQCAKAGNTAMNDPTVPFTGPFKAVDLACAEQIISGKYDNSKTAEKPFVDAVLVEARKHTVALGLGRTS